MKGHHLMKTTIDMSKYEGRHRKRGLLLSLLCAGAVAIFVSGCTDTGYYTYGRTYYPTTYGAYYTPNYGYYGYPYSYYGYQPTYSSRFVVRGTDPYDRYYGYNYY
jgi:hypothetical protein